MSQNERPLVEQCIADFLAGDVPGEIFMRHVMSAEWIVPSDFLEDGPGFVYEDREEKKVLTMFSSNELEELYRKEVPAPTEYRIRTSGYQAMLWLDSDGDQVDFNPGSDVEFNYTRDYFWLLLEWAKGVEIEAMLQDAESGAELLDRLHSFDGFRVVVSRDDSEEKLVLAPDPQKRIIAAIYTAQDAASYGYFEAKERKPDADLHIIKMASNELFCRLEEMPIEGFVFNHAGPGKARAFQKALIKDILEA